MPEIDLTGHDDHVALDDRRLDAIEARARQRTTRTRAATAALGCAALVVAGLVATSMVKSDETPEEGVVVAEGDSPTTSTTGPLETATTTAPGPSSTGIAGVLLDGRPFSLTLDADEGICVDFDSVWIGCSTDGESGLPPHAPLAAAHPVEGPVPESDAAHLLYGIVPEGTDEVRLAFDDGRPFDGDVLFSDGGPLWAAPVEYGTIPKRVTYLDDGTVLAGPFLLGELP